MDTEMITNLRNVILIGTLMTTASWHPDLLSRLARPLSRLRCWFKGFRESLRARLLDKRESAFWEIDMTKFEP